MTSLMFPKYFQIEVWSLMFEKNFDDPKVILNQSMIFVDPKYIVEPQRIDDLTKISDGIMDFDSPKSYGYTCFF